MGVAEGIRFAVRYY